MSKYLDAFLLCLIMASDGKHDFALLSSISLYLFRIYELISYIYILHIRIYS